MPTSTQRERWAILTHDTYFLSGSVGLLVTLPEPQSRFRDQLLGIRVNLCPKRGVLGITVELFCPLNGVLGTYVHGIRVD